jgi:ParB family chromosome partitioning protein
MTTFNKGLGAKGSLSEALAAKKLERAASPRPAHDDRTVTVPGKTGDMQDLKFYKKRTAELELELEDAAGLELPIDQLIEVSGRRRKLSDDEFHRLKENLRSNALVTAVSVIKREDGQFEIVSGHNRVAAYRALRTEGVPGKEKILVVVLKQPPHEDAAQAQSQLELSAFYANLLQPELPEWEKFKGFKLRLTHTNDNQAEVAREAGVSAQYVSNLLAFDKLPDQAKAILDETPHLLGSKSARLLARIAEHGRSNEVIAAIQAIRDEGISPSQAVDRAKLSVAVTVKKPTSIRSGAVVFAESRPVKDGYRIAYSKHASGSQRERLESAIFQLITEFAQAEAQKAKAAKS